MKKMKNKRSTERRVSNGKVLVVKPSVTDEMLDDYSFLDWSKAERSKHTMHYAEGMIIVLIDSNVPTKGK
jgi:hypothetical protein